MLKSLLVASDLSNRSKFALQRAARLAEQTEAALTVMHVIQDDMLEDRIREEISSAEGYLAEQMTHLSQRHAEVVMTAGHAFHVIAEQADECSANVIVMGAHRRQFLCDVFIGTTIERVTRTAGRPVLMVNSKTGERWRRIFVATDMSETSGEAALTAYNLGLFDGADVTFVHAFAPITRQMMTYAGIPADRVHQEAEREFDKVRRQLARFLDGLELGDLQYTARVIEGVGADAIAGFVQQAGADLLVIGTRGLSGIKRLFLGSVAQELMASLEIDIFAVPPQS